MGGAQLNSLKECGMDFEKIAKTWPPIDSIII
jgi:hypothetical protein